MNWDLIAAVAQVLGALGVIASLVYLAKQVRSSGEQSRQAAIHSVLYQMNNIWTNIAHDRASANLWARGSKDISQLKDETEKIQFSALMISLFRPYEEIFHYWKDHRVDDWTWESIKNQCQPWIGTKGFRQWWAMRGNWFSASFQQHVADAMEDVTTYRRWADESNERAGS